jgi:hypothetical protein
MQLPTIEEQVCPLETAEKLSKIGFDIETHYEWVQLKSDCIDASRNEWMPPTLMTRETRLELDAHIAFCYSAPTVAEMGVLLPEKYRVVKITKSAWELQELITVCVCGMPSNTWKKVLFGPSLGLHVDDNIKTEAQARADALIWLKDNGHLNNQQFKR